MLHFFLYICTFRRPPGTNSLGRIGVVMTPKDPLRLQSGGDHLLTEVLDPREVLIPTTRSCKKTPGSVPPVEPAIQTAVWQPGHKVSSSFNLREINIQQELCFCFSSRCAGRRLQWIQEGGLDEGVLLQCKITHNKIPMFACACVRTCASRDASIFWASKNLKSLHSFFFFAEKKKQKWSQEGRTCLQYA